MKRSPVRIRYPAPLLIKELAIIPEAPLKQRGFLVSGPDNRQRDRLCNQPVSLIIKMKVIP